MVLCVQARTLLHHRVCSVATVASVLRSDRDQGGILLPAYWGMVGVVEGG